MDSLIEQSRVLIVERKLVRNRGHHHTQVAALEEILHDCEIFLLVGDGYDGFFPHRHIAISAAMTRLSRAARRLAFGSFRQKLSTRLKLTLMGQPFLRPSLGYASVLLYALEHFKFTHNDVVIVPSATSEDIFSVSEVSEKIGIRSPHFIMRFLAPNLTDHGVEEKAGIQSQLARLAASGAALFTETEELGRHFSELYDVPFSGGFYLPCSRDPSEDLPNREYGEGLRVGVLGLPNRQKGSARVRPIAHALKALGARVNLVVQGRPDDFADNGVYAGLTSEARDGIRVEVVPANLLPEAFEALLLSLDAVLLPYDTEAYGVQGSGIVQDAVAAEVAIIHSRGMSMKRFLEHGNAIAASTDQEFAEAIAGIGREREAVAHGCRTARTFFDNLMREHPLKRLIEPIASD